MCKAGSRGTQMWQTRYWVYQVYFSMCSVLLDAAAKFPTKCVSKCVPTESVRNIVKCFSVLLNVPQKIQGMLSTISGVWVCQVLPDLQCKPSGVSRCTKCVIGYIYRYIRYVCYVTTCALCY